MAAQKNAAGSSRGAQLALAYEQAADAVIEARLALEAAERRAAEAAERMLAFIEARARHPANYSPTDRTLGVQ